MQWIKRKRAYKLRLCRAPAQVARQVAIITWFLERNIERKNRRGCSAVESLKFSAEVARCRDTDCKRYRLSKFGETVSRRSGGGVSEGNFHPLRPLLSSFHPFSRKLATAATSYRRDIRCIRTSFPLNLKSSLRRHSSGRSSNSTGNLTMPKVAPIKSAVSWIRLSDSIRTNFSFYQYLSDHLF